MLLKMYDKYRRLFERIFVLEDKFYFVRITIDLLIQGGAYAPSVLRNTLPIKQLTTKQRLEVKVPLPRQFFASIIHRIIVARLRYTQRHNQSPIRIGSLHRH